jgi:hypothetical protein
MEDWRPVPGLEDRYAISSLGRLKRTAEGKKTYAGKILNPALTKAGYPKAQLGYGRDRKGYYVHRLVAAAFLPAPDNPVRAYVAHKNGNPQDNRAENLYWAAPAENSHDQFLHGTSRGTSSRARKRLTDEDVQSIRKDSRTLTAIADDYGLSAGAIGAIRRGENHRHVPLKPDDIGATRPRRLFTPDDIRNIRSSRERVSVLARRYEVSTNTIYGIVKRDFYTWVDDDAPPA